MRVLFYLPGTTERYFLNVISTLVRKLAGMAEIHIAAPPETHDTGLTEQMLLSCADLPDIRWHVLDGEGYETLRMNPSDPQALVDYIRAIDPDYTFCRTADVTTPVLFPGKTRFIMEAGIPPVALRHNLGSMIMLDGPRLFDQGMMPALSEAQTDKLDRLFSAQWDHLQARFAQSEDAKQTYFKQVGLPLDRKVVVMPLNHQASNNIYLHQHSPIPSNEELVEMIAGQLDEDIVLALTLHPLNLRADALSDWTPDTIEAIVARLGDRARIVMSPGPMGSATTALAQYADGAILGDTKAYGLAAFFGKPILRVSRFSSGPWMNTYSDIKAFAEDVRSGAARGAESRDAMRFLAFHYANNVIAINDPSLTGDDLIARFDTPIDPARWDAGIARIAA